MEESFHLYGMRITVDGDTVEARKRAHLANKLMFQTKMLNTQGLDIIKNNLRLDDGTSVQVLSQHGLDFAKIYVPPKAGFEKEKPRYRTQIQYIPAFDAYNASDEHIGYVLCWGEGFNGPFEFVPKPEDDPTDPYNYGRWLGWYETCPFDDIEEYLKHNLIYTGAGANAGESRELYEVPPAGTRNRIFNGASSVTDNASFTMSNRRCEPCITGSAADGWAVRNIAYENFTTSAKSGYTQKFTMGPKGETGYEPPYVDHSYNGVEMMDTEFDFGELTYRSTSTTEGIIAFYLDMYLGPDLLNLLAALEENYNCEATWEAYDSMGPNPTGIAWQYDENGDKWAGLLAYDGDPLPDLPGGGTRLYITAYHWPHITYYLASSNLYTENERRANGYRWSYSSAWDDEHFALLYFYRNRASSNESDPIEWGECPAGSDPVQAADPNPVEAHEAKVKVVFNGNEYELGDYSIDQLDEAIDSERRVNVEIRLYMDGSVDFVLGIFSIANGDAYPDSRCFFIKTDTEMDDTAVYPCAPGPKEYFPYSYKFPDITFQDQEVYMKNEFRLIKEIKKVKVT